MNDTEEAALAVLESTPAVLRALFSGLPESIVIAPLDRGWSPRQVLAHIVDVDAIAFTDRMRRMVAEEEPTIASIDVLARMAEPGFADGPVEAMLQRFENGRREACAWLRTLTEEQLERGCRHEAGQISVRNLLHYWPTHDMAHVRQVQRMLSAIFSHEIGPAAEYDV